jgi:hypothetical protein
MKTLSTATIFRDLSRDDVPLRRKADDAINYIGPEVGLGPGGLELPKGAVAGVALEAVLRRLTVRQRDSDFDKLPIRFRAIATDVATSEMVVLKRGSLSSVIRASMAIPAVVNPVEIAPVTDLPAPQVQSGFVDADGDGVCDNCGQGMGNPNAPRQNFVDEDGDGVCDNCGAGSGQGPHGPGYGNGAGQNFVDEDGDGVCDNCGQGNGPMANFVDANGDGVCDNMGQNAGQGRGQGQGLGGGFRGGRGG